MKFKQRFYPLLNVSPFSLTSLIEKTNLPLLLPTYHTVSNRPLAHIEHLYPIKNTQQFEQDIDFLLKNFTPITIEDIHRHITGESTIIQPSFHLSFDDGMRDCIETIIPILKRKGISASFYINNDFVDNQHLFYRHQISLLIKKVKNNKYESKVESILKNENISKASLEESLLSLKFHHQSIIQQLSNLLEVSFSRFLKEERPYMTLAEIQQLHQDGFHIGAHSVSHPNYQGISQEEQIKETSNSINFIKKHFPSKVTTFAFPYSSIGISKSFFDFLNKNVDISFGTSGLKLDSINNHLHRFPMEGANFSPQKMIKGEYNAFLLKKLVGKHIFNRG